MFRRPFMTRRAAIVSIFAILGLLLISGCASRKQVSRIDADQTVDLSGNWNDTDSRLVSDEMISDALSTNGQSRPWLVNFAKEKGKNPAVIVGYVRNLSDEHIATGTFLGNIERAFINSGNVRIVSKKADREGVREERQDQQANASMESVKQFGQELGADFMLLGEINKITDQEGGEKATYYQINLNLTNIQTNEVVWMGEKKLKKYIAQKPYKP
jgi:penicillin-binding protein activator